MSAAADILAELSTRGVTVRADGEKLRLRPKAALDDRLLARVREHKPEIIRALSVRPATCAATCYEIDLGRWIHHPWDGCKTCLTPQPEMPTLKVDSVCGHCKGEQACPCITCWSPARRGPGECTVCKGTGKVWKWLQ